jgi:hexosaminidase
MHLDVARHFQGPEFVKHYIDLLAMYKINRFHWHLTEDQGWRIEIDAYPKLTEISAWREQTQIGHGSDKFNGDGQRYGGFYTKDEIREIVAYAGDRFVTIIPEIEMPGHAQAALTAYPEFACTEGPFEVAMTWGVFEDIYCPYDETFEFLETVLAEVIELFPGEYVHIGGDEAPKTRWEESLFVRDLMQREGMTDVDRVQSYFIRRIERFLNDNGKRMIGWDEILEGGLAPNATVMSWRGTLGGIEASRMGHDVVMTPYSNLYFDYYQSEDQANEPFAIGGFLPLDSVYAYEPVPQQMRAEDAAHIIGAQANVWTEYMKTPEQIEYMIFPRMFALAELAWSPIEAKDFADFRQRIEWHVARLDALDVNYRPLDPIN